MDFYTGQELIQKCHEKSLPISDIMKLREITNTHLTAKGKSICGLVLSKAIAYSMAVLEVNASMGLIVAAPTAGSAGVLPGVLLALQDDRVCQRYRSKRNCRDDGWNSGNVSASRNLCHLKLAWASVRSDCRSGRITLSKPKCNRRCKCTYFSRTRTCRYHSPHSIR